MSHEKWEAIDRLNEIKNEIESLVLEAKSILRGTPVYRRAEAYWIPNILESLDGRATMVSMQDTINELEEEEEDEEEEEMR